MSIKNILKNTISDKGAAYLILIDPDKTREDSLPEFLAHCKESGVDGFLIGGSLLLHTNLNDYLKLIKENTDLPVIIFPGGVEQISPYADALLYISLISGRNPDHLIGKHVAGAPIIKKIGIETLSTGYMLIDSGKPTTAEYMSGSKPIPRNKPEIAASTGLAAEYMGMQFLYLEAGSGADKPVPNEMVKMVSSVCNLPVIVGGGLRDPETIKEKVAAGAKIIVTGNYFEDKDNWDKIPAFAKAVHSK